jgi:hypothetical protein
MRISPSHPEIGLERDFKAKCLLTNTWLPIHFNHSSSIMGPAVGYKRNGAWQLLSLARLMYEAYIKEAPLEHGEIVVFSDFDETNLCLSNLELSRIGRKKKGRRIHNPEGYEEWFGNQCGIYI